jgi:flagellar protein FlaG
MIDRLSSNPISSQHRTTEYGGITLQTTEIEENASSVKNEENQETILFSIEKIEEMVDNMNQFMEFSPTELKFEFHEKLNEYYVKIIDEKTKETVREIPPKKMLDFYAAMTEFLGMIVDKKI